MRLVKKFVTALVATGVAFAFAITAPEGTAICNQVTVEAQAATGLSTPVMQAAVYQGNGQVLLSWGKVSGASGYEVYHSTTNKDKSYVKLGETSKTTATANVTEGGTSYFIVRAYRTVNGKVEYSSLSQTISCVTKKVKPDAPKIFAWSLKNDGALIGWNAIAGCSGYDIYYRESGTKEWKELVTDLPSSQCGYHVASVSNGVTFEIAVVSFNKYGDEKVLSDNYIEKITGGEGINCVGMMMDDAVNLAELYGVKVDYCFYENGKRKEIIVKNNFEVKEQYVKNNTLYLVGERTNVLGIFEAYEEISAQWTNLKNNWGLTKSAASNFLDYFK